MLKSESNTRNFKTLYLFSNFNAFLVIWKISNILTKWIENSLRTNFVLCSTNACCKIAIRNKWNCHSNLISESEIFEQRFWKFRKYLFCCFPYAYHLALHLMMKILSKSKGRWKRFKAFRTAILTSLKQVIFYNVIAEEYKKYHFMNPSLVENRTQIRSWDICYWVKPVSFGIMWHPIVSSKF